MKEMTFLVSLVFLRSQTLYSKVPRLFSPVFRLSVLLAYTVDICFPYALIE